ncbi:MAG: hypothetical protein AAGL98_06985 [Planctomycetota bacterium]
MMSTLLAEADWTTLLFENPWPAVIALLGVSSVLRLVGKRQDQKRLVQVSWVALFLGLGVYLTATLVNTDRETLIERTRAMIAATSPVDEPALRALFADRALLLGPEGDVWDELDAVFVARELDEHGVKDNQIRLVDARANRPGVGFSTLDVSSKIMGIPQRSTWELAWQRDADGDWRITSMKWLTFNRQTPTPMYR